MPGIFALFISARMYSSTLSFCEFVVCAVARRTNISRRMKATRKFRFIELFPSMKCGLIQSKSWLIVKSSADQNLHRIKFAHQGIEIFPVALIGGTHKGSNAFALFAKEKI